MAVLDGFEVGRLVGFTVRSDGLIVVGFNVILLVGLVDGTVTMADLVGLWVGGFGTAVVGLTVDGLVVFVDGFAVVLPVGCDVRCDGLKVVGLNVILLVGLGVGTATIADLVGLWVGGFGTAVKGFGFAVVGLTVDGLAVFIDGFAVVLPVGCDVRSDGLLVVGFNVILLVGLGDGTATIADLVGLGVGGFGFAVMS